MYAKVLRLLGRVTSTSEFIPQLDGIRGLAIALVIGHHVAADYLIASHRLGATHLPEDWARLWNLDPAIPWIVHLAFGVQLFFVASGFFIGLRFARNSRRYAPAPPWGKFAARRLVRLGPAYLAANLLYLAWRLSTGRLPGDFAIWGPHLAASLFYLHGPIYASASAMTGVFWTLEIEMQFYLLAPLLARLFRIRGATLRRSVLTAACLATSLIAQFAILRHGGSRLNLSFAAYIQYFLAGFLLADLWAAPPAFLQRKPRLADLTGALSWALLVAVVHSVRPIQCLAPLLIAGAYAGTLWGPWLGRFFSLPILTALGGISYSVYLCHTIPIETLMPFTISALPGPYPLLPDTAMRTTLLLAPILLPSVGLFLIFEQPFMGKRPAAVPEQAVRSASAP